MAENLETKLKPNYEPFEFRSDPKLVDIVEEQKEKYGLKLERGKFYSREHFMEFWNLAQKANLVERFGTFGTFLTSWIGLTYSAINLVVLSPNDSLAVIGLFVGLYGASLGAIALTDRLLPFYERINSKMFNKNYRQYCENNNIPYDTI